MFKLGLLKEIKQHEGRVMLTPEGVKVLVKNGIEVFVEHEAGEKCNFDDIMYERAGASILPTMEKVLQKTELILKVQPPMPIEFELLNESHILLSFFDLKYSVDRMKSLFETGASFISAELIQDEAGNNPLLIGISEIAGRMAIHQAIRLLTVFEGGKGILISKTELSKPAVITVIGTGTAARTAASYALANGAKVNILSLEKDALDNFKIQFPEINTDLYSDEKIRELLPKTDVLVIAVHSFKNINISITKEMISLMEAGSVIIDVSAGQTDILETSHVTSHEEPTYLVNGILHYCVPDMPAAVPVTASRILTKKIVPYIKTLALKGLKDSIVEEPGILPALCIYKGKMTNRYFAEYYGYEFYSIFELLELNL